MRAEPYPPNFDTIWSALEDSFIENDWTTRDVLCLVAVMVFGVVEQDADHRDEIVEALHILAREVQKRATPAQFVN